MSLAETARAYEVVDGIVKRAHRMSRAKGWWDDEIVTSDGEPFSTAGLGKALRLDAPLNVPPTVQAAKLALIHSEVSEALECVRDGDLALRLDDTTGKPEGLPSELADIVIRVADLCGALGIDLGEAIAKKMTYNETRTHRHGGRLL